MSRVRVFYIGASYQAHCASPLAKRRVWHDLLVDLAVEGREVRQFLTAMIGHFDSVVVDLGLI